MPAGTPEHNKIGATSIDVAPSPSIADLTEEDRARCLAATSDVSTVYRIAPTDLVYLWDSCKRCFYDKVKHGFERPHEFSSTFSNADRAMKQALDTTSTIDLGVGPRFRVHSQGVWVESAPLPFPDHGVALSFAGAYDALIITDDEERYVVDYKTTSRPDDELLRFRRQLSCYALALEKPSKRTRDRISIDGLALLVFDPARFVFKQNGKICGLYGPTRWIEFARRDDLFDRFLRKVASVLGSHVAPTPGKTCPYCKLRFGHASLEPENLPSRAQLARADNRAAGGI